jgi:hypothetical protein
MSLLQAFDNNAFDYLDDVELPVLVLGIYQGPTYLHQYRWADGMKPRKIAHQTSGHACIQMYLEGIVLPIRADLVAGVKEIVDHYDYSVLGQMGVSLDELIAYRQLLQKCLPADCNDSYGRLCEGCYPIDAKYVHALTDAHLPERLDDLLIFDTDMDKLFGMFNRWGVAILSENCD